MAVMVEFIAVFGSFAMGMIFDSNNIPQGVMRNGAYQALPYLGNLLEYQGIVLVTIYALTQFIGQTATFGDIVDATSN